MIQAWLLIIQLIRYNNKRRMKGLPPKVNPFTVAPVGFSNQSFANYNSQSHTSSHSSFFEATFNRINQRPPSQNTNCNSSSAIENPFRKPNSFISNNNTMGTRQKCSLQYQQYLDKQTKCQADSYFIAEKHIRASSTIRQELLQIKQESSDLKVHSQYSTQQLEQTLKQHQQSRLQGIVPLSPLKLMDQASPKTKKYVNCQQSAYDLILDKKDKQIELLKLQLERYRRCEHINKENEEIYKRLLKNIKLQFRELKERTESPRVEEPPKSRCINISDTTRFLEQQNQVGTGQAEESYADHIKTPLHLAPRVQNNNICELPEKQIPSTLSPQEFGIPQQKQSGLTNNMTFNAHKHKMKQAAHNKKIIHPCQKLKVYQNNYETPQPHKIIEKNAMADKLQYINQRLWEKQSQRTFARVQNRKSRTRSYMDLSLSAYHLATDSNSYLLKGQS